MWVFRMNEYRHFEIGYYTNDGVMSVFNAVMVCDSGYDAAQRVCFLNGGKPEKKIGW